MFEVNRHLELLSHDYPEDVPGYLLHHNGVPRPLSTAYTKSLLSDTEQVMSLFDEILPVKSTQVKFIRCIQNRLVYGKVHLKPTMSRGLFDHMRKKAISAILSGGFVFHKSAPFNNPEHRKFILIVSNYARTLFSLPGHMASDYANATFPFMEHLATEAGLNWIDILSAKENYSLTESNIIRSSDFSNSLQGGYLQ